MRPVAIFCNISVVIVFAWSALTKPRFVRVVDVIETLPPLISPLSLLEISLALSVSVPLDSSFLLLVRLPLAEMVRFPSAWVIP